MVLFWFLLTIVVCGGFIFGMLKLRKWLLFSSQMVGKGKLIHEQEFVTVFCIITSIIFVVGWIITLAGWAGWGCGC